MSHEITVIVQESRWRTALPDYEPITGRACLAALTAAYTRDLPVAVSIVLADDRIVRQMNEDFRDTDAPTNVLAFPAGANPSTLSEGEPLPLGDIILALQTLQREIREQVTSLENHLTHLVIHGTLHLLGFDHKIPAEAEKMEALEVEILASLGIGNPYK